MAIIEYGPLVSRIQGSIGGVTFRGKGSRAVIQKKGRKGGQPSLAQQRQRTLLAECRASYDSLDQADRDSFDWSVSEGYEVRKETGGKFDSGLSAYTSWYLIMQYCRQSVASPTTIAQPRTLGQSPLKDLNAYIVGGANHLRLYSPVVGLPGWALWMCRAKAANALPSRPVWTLVYPRPGDAVLTWQATGLAGGRAYALDAGLYLAGRLNGYTVGSLWGCYFQYAAGTCTAYRSLETVLTVGSSE